MLRVAYAYNLIQQPYIFIGTKEGTNWIKHLQGKNTIHT